MEKLTKERCKFTKKNSMDEWRHSFSLYFYSHIIIMSLKGNKMTYKKKNEWIKNLLVKDYKRTQKSHLSFENHHCKRKVK